MLETYVVVPADEKIPKLILQLGPAGSHEFMTRYALGSGVNIVKGIKPPSADDGKQFLEASVTATHDDVFDGRQVDADEAVSERLVLQVPKDASLKTLTLAKALDNSGGMSKAFVYDVSGVK